MKPDRTKPYLIYALDEDGAMAHIDSVLNGLACGCICPHCKDKLMAKNGGNVNAHHFAHRDGADCVGAVESALHLLAKEVLSETLSLKIPNGKVIHFDKVVKEEYYPEFALRPDCVGYIGDKILWIEFKRTHAVDARKEEKIVSARIDCIEIDLNECQQDKENLREFITQSKEKRKWIYSAEYGSGVSNRRNRSNSQGERYGYEGWTQPLVRHFAIEDAERLISLYSLEDFDALHHSYTCPSCGKEVVLKVGDSGDYSFKHLDENIICDDEMYLKKTAVAALYQSFISSETFEINIPQFHKCRLHDSCRFHTEECEARREHTFDLKSYGFTRCLKNYRFENSLYQTDLVFCKEDSLEDSIEVFINTENIEIETETSRRTIVVRIWNEDNVCELLKHKIDSDRAHFCRFKEDANGFAEPTEIERYFKRFTFFSSGKFYPDAVRCTGSFERNNRNNVVKEVIFLKPNDEYNESNDYDDMRNFLLSRYKKQGLKLCYCHLCFFLAKNTGFLGSEYICKRYKTKGTPRNPLDVKPIDCPYFSMDKRIESHMAEIANDMDYIEL